MAGLVLLLLFIGATSVCVNAFGLTGNALLRPSRQTLRMEYIPDGLTRAQWEQIKKKVANLVSFSYQLMKLFIFVKEVEAQKAKGDQGAMGTKRFKSRSFEAWQKSGGKHLFPVNPSEVPYEERPYMQRRGGDWEGSDLKNAGLQGKGQGTSYQRLELDNAYEKAKSEGKL